MSTIVYCKVLKITVDRSRARYLYSMEIFLKYSMPPFIIATLNGITL